MGGLIAEELSELIGFARTGKVGDTSAVVIYREVLRQDGIKDIDR